MMNTTQAYRRLAVCAGSVLAFSCSAQAAPPAGKAAATSAVESADVRGRAVLEAQLAALADNTAFAATFAAKAIVLTPDGVSEVHESDAAAAASIASLNPHAEIKRATFDHFASGSAGQLAWFAADLHIVLTSPESASEQHTVRALELLDGNAGWKVTVAAFTRVGPMHKTATTFVRDATAAGPLTKLLTSPTAIADALGDGAIIYGTDRANAD